MGLLFGGKAFLDLIWSASEDLLDGFTKFFWGNIPIHLTCYCS